VRIHSLDEYKNKLTADVAVLNASLKQTSSAGIKQAV